MKVPFMIS